MACDIEVTGSHELPWILYADQSCPSDTGLVDDAAIFEARVNASSDTPYHATKALGSLLRPSALVLVSDELFFTEQDRGTLRSCQISFVARKCTSPTVTLVEGLNCPKGLAIDFTNSKAYIIQYGGGTASDRDQPCHGEARITRVDLHHAVDGSSVKVDVVTGGSSVMVSPTALAVDPLYTDIGQRGILFWTDPAYAGGAVMRAALDGSRVVCATLCLFSIHHYAHTHHAPPSTPPDSWPPALAEARAFHRLSRWYCA